MPARVLDMIILDEFCNRVWNGHCYAGNCQDRPDLRLNLTGLCINRSKQVIFAEKSGLNRAKTMSDLPNPRLVLRKPRLLLAYPRLVLPKLTLVWAKVRLVLPNLRLVLASPRLIPANPTLVLPKPRLLLAYLTLVLPDIILVLAKLGLVAANPESNLLWLNQNRRILIYGSHGFLLSVDSIEEILPLASNETIN
jgi:hypothetical protein